MDISVQTADGLERATKRCMNKMTISYEESQKNNTLTKWKKIGETENGGGIYQLQENKTNMEEKKMEKLKDAALQYEQPSTKNIADLDSVDVELNLEDREGKDNNGEVFKYKVVVVNGEDYRVPGSVIGNLKGILQKKPDLKTFSVAKQGEGMNTRYSVIPLG